METPRNPVAEEYNRLGLMQKMCPRCCTGENLDACACTEECGSGACLAQPKPDANAAYWEARQAKSKAETERVTKTAKPVCNEPHLGLATTQQLLDEIQARIMMDGYSGGGGLSYRTVDSD